ncbi:MAG: ImmA/IrrE family metallo-endopeptidase [Pseudonocardiaceae bacterium]
MNRLSSAGSPMPGPIPVEFQSDSPTPPGRLLRAELDARGMTQADLAQRSGLSTKHLNQVIQGVASLSPDVALILERTLGTPASVWTILEARWQDERSRRRAQDNLIGHIEWAKKFPLNILKERGLLTGSEKGVTLVEKLLKIFRVADPQAFDRVWHAPINGFRRAQHLAVNQNAAVTWLMLAERQTEKISLDSYSLPRLRATIPRLRELTRVPIVHGFPEARQLLAECGVALAFVEDVPGARTCGATWWAGPTRPIIALSARGGREDSVWFSLFHEIGHLLLHSRRVSFIQFDPSTGDDTDGKEQEANTFAFETLIPPDRVPELSRAGRVQLNALAEELGISPGIAAGQRGFLTGEWRSVQKLRQRFDIKELARIAGSPTARDH